jgi:hypothetical protein
MRKLGLIALVVSVVAAPAFADSVKGSILAFDRVAGIIVLNDKTVWPLGDAAKTLPEGLKAGDTIEIDFTSAGENALSTVNSVTLATE